MSATIPANINEERGIVKLGQVAAMKFCVAICSHVGDVNVAHFSPGAFMDGVAVLFNPLSVACRTFIRESLDGNYAHFLILCTLNGQLYLVPCLIHQQFLRTAIGADSLPVDRQYGITFNNIQSRRSEWRGCFIIPGITFYYVSDPVAITLSIIAPVNAKETLLIVWSLAILTTPFIRMGGAQFSLEFPEEVGEF